LPCTRQDTDDVDFLLSMSMSEFGNCIFQLLATTIFIAVIQPWILVGIGPLAVVYYFLQKFYRRVVQATRAEARQGQVARPRGPAVLLRCSSCACAPGSDPALS
jgi:hypothetical protein